MVEYSFTESQVNDMLLSKNNECNASGELNDVKGGLRTWFFPDATEPPTRQTVPVLLRTRQTAFQLTTLES